jgi:hypothetical protein
MAQWNWLVKPETPYTWRFVRNVVIKGLALFVVVNAVFALINPLPLLGRFSAYNLLTPGRDRLPYGENPDQSYNLSLLNLDAMFASHIIAGTPKAVDEYRVLLVGDSSVWGVLLNPEQTVAGYLNAAGYKTSQGKRVRVYNIGYPIQDLSKDVLLLQYAMRYQPDLIVWMITLESFPPDQQLASRLVSDNPDAMRNLISAYHLKSINDSKFSNPSMLDRSIVGLRRALADILRLQLYGPDWAITRIDQRYPSFFVPRTENFDTDVTWHHFKPQSFTTDDLAFDVLNAGLAIAGKAQVIVINEPIFISNGVNSALRYDFFYPRWAYDSYRDLLQKQAAAQGWNYVDLWNLVPPDQFTDSAVHLTPTGSRQLAEKVGEVLVAKINGG